MTRSDLREPTDQPRPTTAQEQSSSYGVRLDPFTHRPAFHSGLDFPSSMFTPIYSTAPGVVSFTGQRNGYGNTVEIDHGDGVVLLQNGDVRHQRGERERAHSDSLRLLPHSFFDQVDARPHVVNARHSRDHR